MSADPGLTDLIAAHLTELITDAPAPNHEEDNYDAGYVAALADLRDSAAFKLVVEQHTNGRTAELEAAVRKRIQLLREHDGFGAAHADGYMGMNWTAYYEGAYQAQVMAAADLENDLRTALEGEQQ